MMDFISDSVFFGSFLTLLTFAIGLFVHKKIKFILFSPLLVSITLCILFLCITKIPYEKYEFGARYISFLLTPSTVCLAIPLYQQFENLKKNFFAIIIGVLSGVLTNAFAVLFFCMIFKIGHTEYVSILPKSLTTAIAFALTEEFHGLMGITAMMVIITGNMGNLFAVHILKLFRIEEPVSKGIAIGTSSHAMGTSKALEIGETEGAMSGLAIAVAGLITVVVLPFFINII